MSEAERYESLRHCKYLIWFSSSALIIWVLQVVLFKSEVSYNFLSFAI